jgi:hypothetical protein
MSDEILLALITGSVSVLINMLTLIGIIYMNKNVNKTHEAVNSKMSELLELTATASKAEGKLEGRLY